MKKCLIFLILVVTFTSLAGAQVYQKELVATQFGTEVGTFQMQLEITPEGRVLNTTHLMPMANLQSSSHMVFRGTQFPLAMETHDFYAQIGPNRIDVNLSWGEEIQYSIPQMGLTRSIPNQPLMAIDNYMISDYQALTWLAQGAVGIVVPTTLPQGLQIIPATVKSLEPGVYQVGLAGLIINIWVDAETGLLERLTIPAQGFEISSTAPVVEVIEMTYDILETEVSIPVPDAQIVGTLSVPAGVEGPFPGVIIVAGSGPTDRDGNNSLIPGEVNNLKEIAQYLSAQGYAVLRYDKRSIGASTHTSSDPVTFEHFHEDISDLMDYMLSLPQVEEAIYLIGHSEGALLTSIVASQREIAGLVLLAGPGFMMGDVLKTQMAQAGEQLEAAGVGQNLVPRILASLEDLYQAIAQDRPFDLASYELPEVLHNTYYALDYQRPFVRNWLVADPSAILGTVKAPVLIIQGDADTQVSVADAQQLGKALPESQRELYIIPGLDHILKMTYGEPLPYQDPTRRVDPEFLEVLSNWLKAN